MSVVMEDPAGELMKHDQYGPPIGPYVHVNPFIKAAKKGPSQTGGDPRNPKQI